MCRRAGAGWRVGSSVAARATLAGYVAMAGSVARAEVERRGGHLSYRPLSAGRRDAVRHRRSRYRQTHGCATCSLASPRPPAKARRRIRRPGAAWEKGGHEWMLAGMPMAGNARFGAGALPGNPPSTNAMRQQVPDHGQGSVPRPPFRRTECCNQWVCRACVPWPPGSRRRVAPCSCERPYPPRRAGPFPPPGRRRRGDVPASLTGRVPRAFPRGRGAPPSRRNPPGAPLDP